jgi:hypothetical protein
MSAERKRVESKQAGDGQQSQSAKDPGPRRKTLHDDRTQFARRHPTPVVAMLDIHRTEAPTQANFTLSVQSKLISTTHTPPRLLAVRSFSYREAGGSQ